VAISHEARASPGHSPPIPRAASSWRASFLLQHICPALSDHKLLRRLVLVACLYCHLPPFSPGQVELSNHLFPGTAPVHLHLRHSRPEPRCHRHAGGVVRLRGRAPEGWLAAPTHDQLQWNQNQVIWMGCVESWGNLGFEFEQMRFPKADNNSAFTWFGPWGQTGATHRENPANA
jgi:hypothetical protein